mgnify:FL=1
MSLLLALDQASRISGWAFFNEGQLEAHGKFNATQEDIGERLFFIKNEVNKLIEEFNINEVAFEDIQLQGNVTNNVQTFKVLAEVFGVIYELVTELKIPNSATLASVWKSALNIKGRTRPEQKRNAQQYVLDTYGIKATQDECDAICIGTYNKKKKAREKIHDWSD